MIRTIDLEPIFSKYRMLGRFSPDSAVDPRKAVVAVPEHVAAKWLDPGDRVQDLYRDKYFRGMAKIDGIRCLMFWPDGGKFNNDVNDKQPRGGYMIKAHWQYNPNAFPFEFKLCT